MLFTIYTVSIVKATDRSRLINCGRAYKSEGFVGSKPCGRADGYVGFVALFSNEVFLQSERKTAKACVSRADERTSAKAF